LSEKQKQQKEVCWSCTGRANLSRGLLFFDKLEARAVLDIFAQDLHIFSLNQLQISFLLLQDSIFKIFVPEIK